MSILRRALVLLTLLAAALAATPVPRAAAPQVLITGARVLDVAAGEYLPASVVLIEGGRIASITKGTPAGLGEDVSRIDASGKTLVPGLVDAYATAAPFPDLDTDYFYALSLANGVTTCRVMNVRTSWGVAQRGRVESGTDLAPMLFTSGRGVDQWSDPRMLMFEAHDPAEAADEVRQQVAAKVDWIAGYENIRPEAYRAMAAALRRTTVRLSGRPGASSMLDLVRTPVSSIDTLAWPTLERPASAVSAGALDRRTPDVLAKADADWLAASPKDLKALMAQVVRARVALVPMLARGLVRAYPDEVKSDPALELLPEARRTALLNLMAGQPAADADRARQAWDSQIAFIRDVAKAGGRVATGSGFEDFGYPVPGAGVHRELRALVRGGLTPAEAIRAATIDAAAMLGAQRSLGQIKPTFQADLLIVDGDPLTNIDDLAKIVTVVRAGEALTPKDLLAEARQAIVGGK